MCGGFLFRAHLREYRHVCVDHADHGHSVALDQLLRNLCGDVHVHARSGAERVDSSPLDGNRESILFRRRFAALMRNIDILVDSLPIFSNFRCVPRLGS